MSQTHSTSVDQWYFEDYVPGSILELGEVSASEQEIIHFAEQFDPQFFHTNPAKAKDSIFGGLIASGWHTIGLTMRLLVKGYISEKASLGSPGIDSIRWFLPVKPDDVLSVRVTITESKASKSKTDRGIVRSLIEARNEDGKVVMSMEAMNMMQRQPL